MITRFLCAALLVVALAPVPAFAGRPLDTEDPGTVEPGKAELELSGDVSRNPEDVTWVAKGVLSFGVLPRFEARIESGLVAVDPDDLPGNGGLGDSLVGLKYRLADETPALPAALAALTVRLPTGDEARGLGAEGVDVGVLGVVGKSLGPFSLALNGGHTFVTEDSALSFWTVAGAVEYRATAAWSVVGEVVSALGSRAAGDVVILRGGTVYAVSEAIRIDGAVGVGMTRDSPDVAITIGVTLALF